MKVNKKGMLTIHCKKNQLNTKEECKARNKGQKSSKACRKQKTKGRSLISHQ